MSKQPVVETIRIQPLNVRTIPITIIGTAPFLQANFSAKAKAAMREKQAAGQQAKGKKVRDARDFDADFVGAQHISSDGWNGMPAGCFRNAAIDVCRMVGYKMTHMKMSLFIEADGLDAIDGTQLVRIVSNSKPEKTEMMVRNATGVADIRVRPMWREWGVSLRVKYDEDQISAADVINLLSRAGQQVGIGEGRPYSKQSNGLGFGTFQIVNADEFNAMFPAHAKAAKAKK